MNILYAVLFFPFNMWKYFIITALVQHFIQIFFIVLLYMVYNNNLNELLKFMNQRNNNPGVDFTIIPEGLDNFQLYRIFLTLQKIMKSLSGQRMIPTRHRR